MDNRKRYHKGATKHCVYGDCKSDSRYDPNIVFLPFPKPCPSVRDGEIADTERHLVECNACSKSKRWLVKCDRIDGRFSELAHVKRWSYICKKHFVDEDGPSELYPDPLSAEIALRIRDSQVQHECNIFNDEEPEEELSAERREYDVICNSDMCSSNSYSLNDGTCSDNDGTNNETENIFNNGSEFDPDNSNNDSHEDNQGISEISSFCRAKESNDKRRCYKGATRHCSFGGCNSDSRYNSQMRFIPFPKACLAVMKELIEADQKHLKSCCLCQRCKRWMQLCKRKDGRFSSLLNVTHHTCLCVKHFVDENGPCQMYPEPMPEHKASRLRASRRKRRLPYFTDDEVNKKARCASDSEFTDVSTIYDIPIKTEHSELENDVYDEFTEVSTFCDTLIKIEYNEFENDLGLNETTFCANDAELTEVSTICDFPTKREYVELLNVEYNIKSEIIMSEQDVTLPVDLICNATQTTFGWKDVLDLKMEIVALREEVTSLKARIVEIESLQSKIKGGKN